jgi:hypothetical protein
MFSRTQLALLSVFVVLGLGLPAVAKPKIAIIETGYSYNSDLVTKLNSTGEFETIATADIFAAQTTTPTLPQLQAYDAVGIYSYWSFDDADAMGDVLASYL